MIKVERSYPAPESLAIEAEKANGSYNLPDVTARLRKDFFDKCYICGIKPMPDAQVEHRLPHKNNTIPGRKYDWDNLFWCCVHCNNVKNKAKYDAGILDCCKEDPEQFIETVLCDGKVSVTTKGEITPSATLTAELIYEVFNEMNTGIRTAACEVRIHEAQEEMTKLYRVLAHYRKFSESKQLDCLYLKALLSRESPFAAIKRGYIRNHLEEYPELESLLALK